MCRTLQVLKILIVYFSIFLSFLSVHLLSVTPSFQTPYICVSQWYVHLTRSSYLVLNVFYTCMEWGTKLQVCLQEAKLFERFDSLTAVEVSMFFRVLTLETESFFRNAYFCQKFRTASQHRTTSTCQNIFSYISIYAFWEVADGRMCPEQMVAGVPALVQTEPANSCTADVPFISLLDVCHFR